MHESLIQWAALVGIIVVGVAFLLELRRWRLLRGVIGHRQRCLRIGLVVLIDALFVMMFLGPWALARVDVVYKLLYWTICLMIGLAVVVLALFDLHIVAKGYTALNRHIFQDLTDTERRDRK